MSSVRLAFAASLLVAAPALAGPVPAAPAAVPFKLGALQLTSLRDASFEAPNDATVFGKDVGAAEVAKVLALNGVPTDKIALSVSALLVRLPGHVVLLDTGLGAGGKGVLVASLALAGVKPDAVTDVLITHSHGDHIGGLVGADGSSVFPKAAIRLSEKEWASVQGQPNMAALAKAVAPQVKTFVPGTPVLPGITPIAIDGHTPGHVGYEIESKGKKLLDIGDTAHSEIISLARPEWAMGFDFDKVVGAASRRATLTRLATTKELVFSPHFPFPGIGRVTPTRVAFAWAPVAK